MRPNTFDAKTLRQCLLRHKIATLPELKRALGTEVDLTVFRKLKPLGYLSSYTYRGSYYSFQRGTWFRSAGPGNSWSLIAADRVPNAVLAVPTVFAKAPTLPPAATETRAR